jgi:curli biogenesis system outer membrane secretion channel CsgG
VIRWVVLIVAAAASVLGCASDPRLGYANVSSYNADVESIAIPIFENSTHYHGTSTLLTQALVREVQRHTPWRFASGTAADTTLTGQIVDIELERLGVDNDTGLGNEMAVDIAVDFRWVDNRTGRSIVARRNFRESATFVPAVGVREPIEIGIEGAVERLAESIVAELRTDW